MRCYATETMTCVGRYVGTALQINSRTFHFAAYRNGTTDDVYITANWADASETENIRNYLRLNTHSGLRYFNTMDGWEDPVCRLSWSNDLQDIAIAGNTSRHTLTENGEIIDQRKIPIGQYSTLPVFSMNPVLYANYTHNITWTLNAREGRSGFVTGLYFAQRNPGDTDFHITALYENRPLSSQRLTLRESLLGKEVYLCAEYRTFSSNWNGSDLENFVTLNRFNTPIQLLDRDGGAPLAPAQIDTSLPVAGGRITVSWAPVADSLYAIGRYILERAVTDEAGTVSEFVRLYAGEGTRFRDTLPNGLTGVCYRVCAESGSLSSAWTETGWQEIAQSNIYVGTGGRWLRAAAVTVGGRKASPMAIVL